MEWTLRSVHEPWPCPLCVRDGTSAQGVLDGGPSLAHRYPEPEMQLDANGGPKAHPKTTRSEPLYDTTNVTHSSSTVPPVRTVPKPGKQVCLLRYRG